MFDVKQSLHVFSFLFCLKPGAVQNIALHALPAVRTTYDLYPDKPFLVDPGHKTVKYLSSKSAEMTVYTNSSGGSQ